MSSSASNWVYATRKQEHEYMKRNLWVVLISLALITAGCSSRGHSDAQVASDVQNKINGDNNIPDKQMDINANGGIVTLNGTVSSDAARNAAANDAAQVAGVKTVVNNLQVSPSTVSSQAPEPQQQADNNPPPPMKETRPSPRAHERSSRQRSANSDNGDN